MTTETETDARMVWNHRIVRVHDGVDADGNDEWIFILAEVSYHMKPNNNGEPERVPYAYTAPCMLGESVEELKELVWQLSSALSKPVIDSSDLLDNSELLG